MSFDLKSYLDERKALVEAALKTRWMPPKSQDPTIIHAAMHYSLFADGKRVRPALALAAGEILGLAHEDVLPIAAALEMIHVFSLIHDDLPAMDDDDLRRGQPTNHIVYGEAIAILAGDALAAHAFIPLTDLNPGKFRAENILKVIRLIAEATGTPGMIGGQVIDLESEGQNVALERLKTLHSMKTGALIRAAVTAPAVLCGAAPATLAGLTAYGDAIGLAFQIADDILDIEGGAEIGKDVGSDVANAKSTYPSLMGLDVAKRERSRMRDLALASLADFGDRAEALSAIARYIVERKK